MSIDTTMLIVACIDGASTSSGEDSLSGVVQQILDEEVDQYHLEEWRASLLNRRKRAVIRYLRSQAAKHNALILVGKSLGGLIAVQAWNACGSQLLLGYRRICMMTVDPNWPLLWDWSPNLNAYALRVAWRTNTTINVFVGGSGKQQCGAQLVGPGVENRCIIGPDHFSIVHHHAVKEALCELIDECEGTKP